MIVNKEKFKLNITELLMLIASVLYFIGIRSWFAVCPVGHENIMSCHWAGEVLKAISILMLVVSVIHIFLPDHRMKIGADIPMIGICITAALVPGGIINLCMMEEMACRQAAKPWTIIFSIVMALILLADILLSGSAISREKHGRKADV